MQCVVACANPQAGSNTSLVLLQGGEVLSFGYGSNGNCDLEGEGCLGLCLCVFLAAFLCPYIPNNARIRALPKAMASARMRQK